MNLLASEAPAIEDSSASAAASLGLSYPLASEAPAIEGLEVKPALAPAEKPALAPAEKPALAPAEKPALAPAEKPALAPAEKPASVALIRPNCSEKKIAEKPQGGLNRNNTSFPIKNFESLKNIKIESKWHFLKYYQNIVRIYMKTQVTSTA